MSEKKKLSEVRPLLENFIQVYCKPGGYQNKALVNLGTVEVMNLKYNKDVLFKTKKRRERIIKEIEKFLIDNEIIEEK